MSMNVPIDLPLTLNRSNWSNWLLLSTAAVERRHTNDLACWEACCSATDAAHKSTHNAHKDQSEMLVDFDFVN